MDEHLKVSTHVDRRGASGLRVDQKPEAFKRGLDHCMQMRGCLAVSVNGFVPGT
jgi:hypothetical protein